MSLAGWAVTRLVSGTAFAGLVIFVLSRLQEFPPPAVVEAPPLAKSDRAALPAAVPPPIPSSKKVRTIPIYVQSAPTTRLPSVPEPPPIVIKPVAVAPILADPVAKAPAPVMAAKAPAPVVTPAPAMVPAKPIAKSSPPGDRFARFCRGRGKLSWMRFKGVKRYCK